MLASDGLRTPAEGHHLQYEGLWDILRRDRTRFILGQWGHATPSSGGREDWLNHYLRDGPRAVKPGVVE